MELAPSTTHSSLGDALMATWIGDVSSQKLLVPDSATARVYALCISSSNQKLLYWMEAPDPTLDAEKVARLNQLIVDDAQMAME